MTFSEDNIQKQVDTVNPTWEFIQSSLNNIDPILKSYCILSDDPSYVQCAGSKERLCIEYRKLYGETYKHFVVGNKKNENSTSIIWTQINCKVGPIRIHDNEVLTIDDAIKIFKAFYEGKGLPEIYNLRNTTKQFHK
jgi:hypothetical protein